MNNLHSITLYKLHNKLSCVSSSTSRASRVRRVKRVVSSESSCAVRLARHSQNAWARHVERVESSRAKWNLALTDSVQSFTYFLFGIIWSTMWHIVSVCRWMVRVCWESVTRRRCVRYRTSAQLSRYLSAMAITTATWRRKNPSTGFPHRSPSYTAYGYLGSRKKIANVFSEHRVYTEACFDVVRRHSTECPLVLWHCWFGYVAHKDHSQNDRLCVGWATKLYSHTCSLTPVVLWCRVSLDAVVIMMTIIIFFCPW